MLWQRLFDKITSNRRFIPADEDEGLLLRLPLYLARLPIFNPDVKNDYLGGGNQIFTLSIPHIKVSTYFPAFPHIFLPSHFF